MLLPRNPFDNLIECDKSGSPFLEHPTSQACIPACIRLLNSQQLIDLFPSHYDVVAVQGSLAQCYMLGSPYVLEKFTEGHYEHDLLPEDRSKLQIAASSRKTHPNIAGLIGIHLGFLFAYRIRANRNAILTALGALDRPSHVVFSAWQGWSHPRADTSHPPRRPQRLCDVHYLSYQWLSFWRHYRNVYRRVRRIKDFDQGSRE